MLSFTPFFTPEPGLRPPQHQARLIRRAIIAGAILTTFFALFDTLVTGHRFHATFEFLSALALCVLGLCHARGMGNDRTASLGILVAGLLFLVVVLSSKIQDGVLVWLVAFPTLPSFILGRRLCLVINITFTVVTMLALSFVIHTQGNEQGFTWNAAIHTAGAMIFVAVLSFLYETMRGTAARDLAQETKTDPLTGLLNRRGLHDAYPRESAAARRFDRPLSLLILDVDHFKQVNDTFGHDGGDMALQFVVETMNRLIRENDWPARIGGEEFAVLLPNTDLMQARGVGEKIRTGIEAAPFVLAGGRRVPLTVSIGIAQAKTSPKELGEDLDALLVRANQRLHSAKAAGRNQVVWED